MHSAVGFRLWPVSPWDQFNDGRERGACLGVVSRFNQALGDQTPVELLQVRVHTLPVGLAHLHHVVHVQQLGTVHHFPAPRHGAGRKEGQDRSRETGRGDRCGTETERQQWTAKWEESVTDERRRQTETLTLHTLWSHMLQEQHKNKHQQQHKRLARPFGFCCCFLMRAYYFTLWKNNKDLRNIKPGFLCIYFSTVLSVALRPSLVTMTGHYDYLETFFKKQIKLKSQMNGKILFVWCGC